MMTMITIRLATMLLVLERVMMRVVIAIMLLSQDISGQ